jgi:pyruvate, orthophosphate dikinase
MSDAPRWTICLDGSSLPNKKLIGGKAWSVARMRAMALPVPPAFVITTDACLAYLDQGGFPDGLKEEIASGIAWLEKETGRHFGSTDKPLLLSVRSGAAVSMPGMMDTVLNLGIDATTELALADETGLPEFARDTRRRFVELYSAIVLKDEVSGAPLPATVCGQLHDAIRAVFDSWNTRRARRYRDHNKIPHDLGTAVTVQAMVFGNLDEHSGTGVIFSRNPLNGNPQPYGEYLPRAQGEDVVSGKFTPLTLEAMHGMQPAAHDALLAATSQLEAEHCDIQDIEFTVQSGKLYLLQARSAKRAPDAAVRAAIDMVAEGLIDRATALTRVSPEQVRTLLLPRLKIGSAVDATVIAAGEGACPGIASGVFVTDPDEAERRAASGEAVILLRATTSPDDIHGMIAARAVVTEQGGSTSHAAVVSRALGRPCVVGIGAGSAVRAGSTGTVDGAAGQVYDGILDVEMPEERANPYLATLIGWASQIGGVRVVRPADAGPGADAVDVDEALSKGDVDALQAALRGASVARGALLADPDNARAAVAHGVRTIVTEPVLPAMLATIGVAA